MKILSFNFHVNFLYISTLFFYSVQLSFYIYNCYIKPSNVEDIFELSEKVPVVNIPISKEFNNTMIDFDEFNSTL